MSELGYRVADLLDVWEGGLHHVDHSAASKANWWDPVFVEIKFRHMSLTTFDGDNLTRLVFLSHDKLIRVDIDALTVGMFRFMFHGRHVRDGGLMSRFPTIETQLSRWRERYPYVEDSHVCSPPPHETSDGHELQKAIDQGFDVRGPVFCSTRCFWLKKVHGLQCPQGGCIGSSVDRPK